LNLDTLSEKKFAAITRRDGKGLYKVLASVFKAVALKLPVKINCVLMRNTNEDEIAEFVNLTKAVRVCYYGNIVMLNQFALRMWMFVSLS
jgi:cyclic pyranopterin phosphate synthase